MAERSFIFRGGTRELVLPVTPKSYEVDDGINTELINIHQLGDVLLTGYGTLSTIKVSCMFPATSYPFSRSSDAEIYVQQFRSWVSGKQKLRFVIGNTGVNIPVIIENFSYGEKDGTNDVYATIQLREYRDLQAMQIQQPSTGNRGRAPITKEQSASTYETKYGDTLTSVCTSAYGAATAAMLVRLAAVNSIKNPALLAVKTVLTLPGRLG